MTETNEQDGAGREDEKTREAGPFNATRATPLMEALLQLFTLPISTSHDNGAQRRLYTSLLHCSQRCHTRSTVVWPI